MRVIPTDQMLKLIGNGWLFTEGYSPAHLSAQDTYTFRLGSSYYALNEYGEIDGRKELQRVKYRLSESGRVVHPGRFLHLTTMEHLRLDARTMVMLSTHPSLAKLGLDLLHLSWLVPPGSSGPLTLETSNTRENPVRLFPGMKAVKALFIDIGGDNDPMQLFRHLSAIAWQM